MTRKIPLLFALTCLLLPSIMLAQGSIRGSVNDGATNEPLIGVNVFLVGTALGASTDLYGSYLLPSIPGGTYIVRISYLGYEPQDHEVTITSEEVRLDILLTPKIIEGEEVIVTGQARGQVAAINQQITANTIMNVVSEERIQELPDVNAAEVIGRLPGVSILRSGGEANKVILRGLSDRYTTVTIDGIKIPPTDADARGVDLSMISQGSLAGVELFKALTPDKDGDALAGSVNLVTKKAPSERMARLDARGDYNHLMGVYDQYDIGVRYGERFFSDVIGLQLSGNAERRNRSNERSAIGYNQGLNGGQVYEISDFELEFTDEIRTRQGFGILADIATPDAGVIRLNNIYSQTKRDYLVSTRNYPTGSGSLVRYEARDREEDIVTVNASIQGDNTLFGFGVNWGLSFAQSEKEYPYDYAIDFIEPSIIQNGIQVSGMRPSPQIRENPETLIPYALNNFQLAYAEWGYYRTQRNLDKERTVFLNVSKQVTVGDLLIAEIKAGGKYREKDRTKNSGELFTPYYLGFWRTHMRLPDGTIVPKSYAGTPFQIFMDRFNLSGGTARTPFASDFLDPTPADRNIFGQYMLNPIVNRDLLRLWYDLNKDGVDVLGRNPEYYDNPSTRADYYAVVERISGGYLMTTLNYAQVLTFLAGFRVEQEQNDYLSRFSPGSLGGFPISGVIRDTSAAHTETIWLPNFHLTFRPTEFMNIRFAAYRALARPDFNMRIEKYIATGGGGRVGLLLGNPNLRTAKAWNFEVNTSLFSPTIGLFSISAFYKDIRDMHHQLVDAGTSGNVALDSLGIAWRTPFLGGTQYQLTVPYNSTKPTKVWGFEIEHQLNFTFLPVPDLLKNIVLSYNASIVRSETHLISTSIETTYVQTIPGFPPLPVYNSIIVGTVQKLEGQPEFYGNVSLGYDIGGFSIRISLFHQGSYNSSFTAAGLSDIGVDSYSRWDLAVKQVVTENISVLLNVNNLTDIRESETLINRSQGWSLPRRSERYGLTADLGIRFTL